MRRRIFLISAAATLFIGCGSSNPPSPNTKLTAQQITVGCGMCKFDMPSNGGCYWAAEINGQHYVVQGNTPIDHQNHAPDGMCNITRTAVVDGTIEGRNLFAKRFELLPPADVPASPEFTPADIHRSSGK